MSADIKSSGFVVHMRLDRLHFVDELDQRFVVGRRSVGDVADLLSDGGQYVAHGGLKHFLLVAVDGGADQHRAGGNATAGPHNAEGDGAKLFRSDGNLKELSGYRQSPAGRLYYTAKPIAIGKESCLRCHSTPEAAPRSQLTTYGRENGSGWQLNEIVGAQMISVPASGVINSARRAFLLFMGIVAGAFLLVMSLLNWLLRRAVINPIKGMAVVANEISLGNMEADFQQKSNDEIGKLAAAFNRMKTSLSMAMEMLGQRE